MAGIESRELAGGDLTERERQVLEAVVRTYVETAEPAGSRTLSLKYELGVSPATVRNTMSDLEAKGYLYHPHTSAGRVPTDHAYRFFVDRLMEPHTISDDARDTLERELDRAGASAMERLIGHASRALTLISSELGIAVEPRLESAVLEKLDLIQVSASKVLMVATITAGLVRTVYVDLPVAVPAESLQMLTAVLNERLAGVTLKEIRATLPVRLRDAHTEEAGAAELLNIFVQSRENLFDPRDFGALQVHLGNASILAVQPEFESGERLKGLMELTERRELLARAVGRREHGGGLKITIGAENDSTELSDFTLVTAEYDVDGLKGVIGVIGPTRMPYEKVVAIVDYTSSLVTRFLQV